MSQQASKENSASGSAPEIEHFYAFISCKNFSVYHDNDLRYYNSGKVLAVKPIKEGATLPAAADNLVVDKIGHFTASEDDYDFEQEQNAVNWKNLHQILASPIVRFRVKNWKPASENAASKRTHKDCKGVFYFDNAERCLGT